VHVQLLGAEAGVWALQVTGKHADGQGGNWQDIIQSAPWIAQEGAGSQPPASQRQQQQQQQQRQQQQQDQAAVQDMSDWLGLGEDSQQK
jgi:hypothetical protein